MSGSDTQDRRQALIDALTSLADKIETSPPPVIGSDIFVRAGPGASAIGSSISVVAGGGGAGGVGQRISVVAQPGQSVIGQRITMVVGDGPTQAPPAGASSQSEIAEVVAELRDAAKVLASSSGSETWVKGILKKATAWGSAALTGAISGASNAAMKFYLTGA